MQKSDWFIKNSLSQRYIESFHNVRPWENMTTSKIKAAGLGCSYRLTLGLCIIDRKAVSLQAAYLGKWKGDNKWIKDMSYNSGKKGISFIYPSIGLVLTNL